MSDIVTWALKARMLNAAGTRAPTFTEIAQACMGDGVIASRGLKAEIQKHLSEIRYYLERGVLPGKDRLKQTEIEVAAPDRFSVALVTDYFYRGARVTDDKTGAVRLRKSHLQQPPAHWQDAKSSVASGGTGRARAVGIYFADSDGENDPIIQAWIQQNQKTVIDSADAQKVRLTNAAAQNSVGDEFILRNVLELHKIADIKQFPRLDAIANGDIPALMGKRQP